MFALRRIVLPFPPLALNAFLLVSLILTVLS